MVTLRLFFIISSWSAVYLAITSQH